MAAAAVFAAASTYARQHKIPRLYLAANSGARIGLAKTVRDAFKVACSAGQLAVLGELREARGKAVAAYLAGKGGDGDGGWEPVWEASKNGRLAVVEWLVGHQ